MKAKQLLVMYKNFTLFRFWMVALGTQMRQGGGYCLSSSPEHIHHLWGLILPTAPWKGDHFDWQLGSTSLQL